MHKDICREAFQRCSASHQCGSYSGLNRITANRVKTNYDSKKLRAHNPGSWQVTRAKNNGTQPLRQRLYRSRASNTRVAKQEKHPDERDERRLIVFRQTRIDSPGISTRLYQRNNDGAEPGLRNISIEHYATLEKHRQGCARRQAANLVFHGRRHARPQAWPQNKECRTRRRCCMYTCPAKAC